MKNQGGSDVEADGTSPKAQTNSNSAPDVPTNEKEEKEKEKTEKEEENSAVDQTPLRRFPPMRPEDNNVNDDNNDEVINKNNNDEVNNNNDEVNGNKNDNDDNNNNNSDDKKYLEPDGTTFHLGVKDGEICPRILTVGCFRRAEALLSVLDKSPPVRTVVSSRNFHVHSGTFNGTPVSIVAIGMGAPMMDFFVREAALLFKKQPMAIVRLGTCGFVNPQLVPGDVVVAGDGSSFIYKNYASFEGLLSSSTGHKKRKKTTNEEEEGRKRKKSRLGGEGVVVGGDDREGRDADMAGTGNAVDQDNAEKDDDDHHDPNEKDDDDDDIVATKLPAYIVTKPISPSQPLSKALFDALKYTFEKKEKALSSTPKGDNEQGDNEQGDNNKGENDGKNDEGGKGTAVHWGTNASSETFYSGQGRPMDDFNDCTFDVVDRLHRAGFMSLEMETHQLFHLGQMRGGSNMTHTAACAIGVVNRVNKTRQNCVEARLLKEKMLAAGRSCLEALTSFPLT